MQTIADCSKQIDILEQSIKTLIAENQGNTSLDVTWKISKQGDKLLDELLILNKLKQNPERCQIKTVSYSQLSLF